VFYFFSFFVPFVLFRGDFTFAQNPFIFINFYPKPAKTVYFNEIIFRRFQKIIKNERF